MSSSATSKAAASPAPGSLGSPKSFRNRRSSINSIAASSIADKEQLAHALDHIHNTASQSNSLTTFNDFAPPPDATPSSEARGTAGELVHQGLSGLYSRLREAVGGGSPAKTPQKDDDAKSTSSASKRASIAETHASKNSISSLNRGDSLGISVPATSQTISAPDLSSSGVLTELADARPQASQSSKSASISFMAGQKTGSSSRQSLPMSATSPATIDANFPPPSLHRDPSRSTIRTEDSTGQTSSRKSIGRAELGAHLAAAEQANLYDPVEGKLPPRSKRDDTPSVDGSIDNSMSPPPKPLAPSLPKMQTHHVRSPSNGSSMLSPDDIRRRPTLMTRLSDTRSPIYPASRESSADRGTAAPSSVSMSAHGSAYHEPWERDSHHQQRNPGDPRTSGSANNHEGASDQMNAQLDKMRRQVLSKEFWMKDDTVKECFMCQTPFSAFRRKHHCRTCGCIFDSKCTTVVSGEKFGVQGSLRVCKRCLDVITRRIDGSGSEDSGDEQSFMPRIFGLNHTKPPSDSAQPKLKEQDWTGGMEGSEDSRPVTTPMMAIPATRRVNKESNRKSAVLEIDVPQLSRPGSSRSLKSLASGRPQSSAGHKRHHSKHGILGRYKPTADDRAPFRKGVDDETKKSKFPAFHDDNIIDPELADYMSDDSSGDEQVNIFSTMSAAAEIPSGSYENEKSNLGSFMNASKRHRHRAGEKSVSGMSYVSRGAVDDVNGPASLIGHRRTTRRRNLSNVSGSVRHLGSPRPKSVVYKGHSASTEMLASMDNPNNSNQAGTQLTRSDSLQLQNESKEELNSSSLKHIDKLLHQLLEDARMPDPEAWQKALVPIFLKSTDDVTPDVAKNEDMDIRHYVKLKRIPGGKPGDTSYISGVVFTKNLALKSMSRRIRNPRIVLVTFPIEYQRHQQHFMSLQPVIEQEKEFLRVVVQRITNLRPHVLLAEKSVSGVALQYLSDANISVAYNVKHTVIEAVARCAETEIISSLDMLALPVQVGRCAAFEVKTFVNNDYPGRKKSYIFLSGCKPALGCTIALRGANSALLAKVKHIVEFMVYVVYNLKLESSLLRDESVEAPNGADSSMSNSFHALNDSFKTTSSGGTGERVGPTVLVNQPSSESELPSQTTVDSSSIGGTEDAGSLHQSEQPTERPNLISLHDSHTHPSQENQVPDDVPMPSFYSDMVAKYETKILSASPYVKFKQPYLLMKAREQERRLLYLRRLRDHDIVEEVKDGEKLAPQKFQLIKPELVEQIGQKAPRQTMEVLHAVHDAEYDKALFNYQTQTRQWETYIQGNLDLFDPYSHQNIVVLYSVICTETKIPCIEPTLVAINFYDEQHVDTGMDPDCTLGQYVEDLVYSKDDICNSNGCEKKMLEHHRTYVHDQWRITVFVDYVPNAAPRRPELGDGITMWTYCKTCQKDSEERPMSETTFKYSFGKYLELLYWGRGLRMKSIVDCVHDHLQDHVRYFSLHNSRIRIHWDPIDLLEIVVPRARITWKVVNDLKLKNEIFTRMEARWNKFMTSVKARLKSIRIDSVLPEKADSCRAELEKLSKKAQEEQSSMIRRMQDIYVNSKYYEVVPFNSLVREMLEKAGEWDQAFAKFETDYLGDKDMRQLTVMQLKKMFTDDESKESLVSTEGTGSTADSEERPSQTFSEVDEKSTQPTEYTDNSMEASATSSSKPNEERPVLMDDGGKVQTPAESVMERMEPLDLSSSPTAIRQAIPIATDSITRIPVPADAVASQRPPVSPAGTGRTPTDSSLSGQSLVEKMRGEQGGMQSGIPVDSSRRGVDRTSSRKSGSNVSPPMVRATSHPARTMSRSQSSTGKAVAMKDKMAAAENQPEQPTEKPVKTEKKLSEILGLTSLNNRGKPPASGIPRLVHKKKESKVSSWVRHFEQLSREFEKERIRASKKRAASMRQPRAMLPRTSTKAIVEVYDDVNQAFEETHPVTEQELEREGDERPTVNFAPELEEPGKSEPSTEPPTPIEAPCRSENQNNEEADDATQTNTSQGVSDDEGGGGELEASLTEEYLPEMKDISESLEPDEAPSELPKHQKTSLMKYLTNFWAERSASGWPPLEYPVNATDHVFVDSDIIVREDEPSSVIALALNSDDYQGKLAESRRDAQLAMQREESGSEAEPRSVPMSDSADWMFDEGELEKSLLRVTGTHLKYQFKEGAAIMTCKIFYAEQFDALRRKCGVAERIVESLSRCLKWDSRGGKTKSVFLKTLDDRLVLKSLSPVETSAFLDFAPSYFSIMAEALFHDLPSVIAKMLGFFQVFIKNPVTGTDVKLDLLITENLFYDRSPSRIFDLKGSMRNRKIQSTGEQNEVLLDENMVEYIYESPLFAREHSKKLLRASVWNDTLFLARQNVMDYSLMIAVDDARKELVVGIIDCIRTYTWDKKLESYIKDRGFAGGGRNKPTVTSPKEYKSRFREAMARYILQAPNCWHLFNNPQHPMYYGRARFEEPETAN